MQISINSYADFITTVRAVSQVDVVLFWDNSPSEFVAFAIFGGGKVAAYAGTLSSKPGTFDADFPEAVALAHNFGIG